MKKFIAIPIGLFLLIMPILFFRIGYNFVGNGVTSTIKIIREEIHYNDNVEVIKGFYTGSKGVVMKRSRYDNDSRMADVYINRQGKGEYGFRDEIITVNIKYLKRIEQPKEE